MMPRQPISARFHSLDDGAGGVLPATTAIWRGLRRLAREGYPRPEGTGLEMFVAPI